MPLGASDQVFLIGEIEEYTWAEAAIDLDNAVSEGFLVNVHGQCQWKHVLELEQDCVKCLDNSQEYNWVLFENLVHFFSLMLLWRHQPVVHFIGFALSLVLVKYFLQVELKFFPVVINFLDLLLESLIAIE